MPHANYQAVALRVASIDNQLSYVDKYSFWKRLEPRAREDNFLKSVQAAIRDPLWMLTRQWQLAEFKGEDAGSPIKVEYQTERSSLTHCKAGPFNEEGTVKKIEKSMPLETFLEQESFVIDYRLSVQIGQELEEELNEQGLSQNIIDIFKEKYSFEISEKEEIETDDETLDFLQLVSGRVINGKKVFDQIFRNENPVLPGFENNLSEDEISKIETALKNLNLWFKALYAEPLLDSESSWDHSAFNYSCSVSAPNENGEQHLLEVSESPGGELDWPYFTVLRDSSKILEHSDETNNFLQTDELKEVIPTPIEFTGMPNSRFWAFEDAKVNFGSLDVKTTDLSKLLLMEFALVYSDDWFHIPIPLDIGSICKVKKLDVYDVFGDKHEIQRAGSNSGESWQRWDMFSTSYKHEKQLNDIEENKRYDSAPFLFFPPTLGRNEVSANFDEVLFLRDELANMAWAVQHTVPNGLGTGISGFDYWKSRNDKQDLEYFKTNNLELFTLFKELIPGKIESIKTNSLNIEDIERLLNDMHELKDMISSIDKLKELFETENIFKPTYLNELYLQSLVVEENKSILKAAIDSLSDFEIKSKLLNIYNRMMPKIDLIVETIISFKNILYANTLEAHETFNLNIKENLNKIFDLSDLSQKQQKLLHMVKESERVPIYRLISSVPENWIPYVPVKIESSDREIQLVQGRMIRGRNSDTEFIEPISRILQTAESSDKMHALNEEAVARHGLKVCMHMQRARWIDGSTHVWTARKVSPGKGEGSSGLRFDFLEK